jgi:hypothetical protein
VEIHLFGDLLEDHTVKLGIERGEKYEDYVLKLLDKS